MKDLDSLKKAFQNILCQLKLSSLPVAVKFIKQENEIPEGSLRPFKDRGQHYAQCQAFALSRFQCLTVAMLKEDHWCWGPLLGYGLVDHRPALTVPATARQAEILPRLELGEYIGLVCAPVSSAGFLSDIVLIYSNTAQLRQMLMALKYMGEDLVTSQFDAIDSCIYSTVPTLLTGKIRITLPDPGESHRAGAGDDEIILSLPVEKIAPLAEGLERTSAFSPPANLTKNISMVPDFPRPEFYDHLFKVWGLSR
ncbi:MAG TPA: DUF169 domain-containing protein [Dehalococcoidales bacterium]|nr:DUF169 domain-containing protein [Dehalococcoidales bacterium]